MRILEIIPQLDSGGGERFTVDLCNELAKQHTVRLVVLFPLEKNGFYANEISPQVEVVSMNKKYGLDITLPFKLLREILAFKPDVVQTHLRAITYEAMSTIMLRSVVHCHTVHSAADKEAGSIIGSTMRRLLFKCNIMTPITISEESHRSFVDFYGLDAPMIFNGRNVPDNLAVSEAVNDEINSYRPEKQSRIIVNLARLMEVKRQPLIAKVCRRLQDDGYRFAMLMIGRCESDEYLTRINESKCDFVHVLGERKNPLEYLAASDGYCLMSSFEGMPISLIEALGTKAVPVCTPVGGIVDVIKNGENGFLAEDLSEDACYMALKSFLDTSDAKLAEMKQAARLSYEPFSMTKCAENYEDLFEKLIKREIT